MNRFAAAGLFVEAAKGRRILVVTPRVLDVSEAMRCFMANDDEADRRESDGRRDEFYRDARAIVAASPDGEIVRA